MTTTAKRIIQFKDEGQTGSFKLEFTTTSGVDPHGDSDHPTSLSLYFEQMDSATVDEDGSTVAIRFHGTWEFHDFHRAISRLARELNETYGETVS